MLDFGTNGSSIVSGRAVLSRMEGEFTRLSQIYGNAFCFIVQMETKTGTIKTLGF